MFEHIIFSVPFLQNKFNITCFHVFKEERKGKICYTKYFHYHILGKFVRKRAISIFKFCKTNNEGPPI
jgi:hypothetical protein